MAETTKHFLFVPIGAWGHVRPLISMTARLLSGFPQVQITWLTEPAVSKHTEVEFGRFNLSEAQKSRIRFIQAKSGTGVEGANGEEDGKGTEEFQFGLPLFLSSRQGVPDRLREVYPALLQGKGVPVTAVVMDMAFIGRAIDVLTAVEEELDIPPERVPKRILTTPLHPAYHDLYHFDHCDPPIGKFIAERVEAGDDQMEVFKELILNSDTLVKVTGCTPMYAYELDGKNSPAAHTKIVTVPFRKAIPKMHGVIVHSPPCLAEDSMRLWSTRLYTVGPTVGPVGSLEPLGQSSATEVREFLNEAVKKYGEKSVAFICFGSLFYPPTEYQTTTLIQALANRGKPALFVLGGANPEEAAQIRKEVAGLKGGGGLIKVVPGAPQQAVLAHPAVGWFLSHGGQSSTAEAISAGVPTIIWQSGIDQIFIANQMSQVQGAAIELVQVRVRHAIGKPTHRGGLVQGTEQALAEELEQAFADIEVGGARREGILKEVKRLRGEFEKDLQEGGGSHLALERFVNM